MSQERIFVTGIGMLSCLGNKQQTWEALSLGKCGLKLQQPFDFLPPLPLGLINEKPSALHPLTDIVIKATLEDAQISAPQPHMGVVIGSSRGCQGNWESMAQTWLQERKIEGNWLTNLPSQPAQMAAHFLHTNAPVFAPMTACATGLTAIAQGYELIKQGYCQRVIAGAVEAPITPLTMAGFSQLKALSRNGCYPFASYRDGMALAEGGALLILETATSAKKRQAKIYGEIIGWGLTCDATEMTAPEASADSALWAIKHSLSHNNLSITDIDHIQTHGTGTVLNDAREARLISQYFPQQPYVNHLKGSLGHCLGGSGALSLALTLMSLQRQTLLPNHNDGDYNLNWVNGVEGAEINYSLCFSFGFGGQNAIIAIKRYDN